MFLIFLHLPSKTFKKQEDLCDFMVGMGPHVTALFFCQILKLNFKFR